jgi:uncharacterized protein (TIGR03083 family)
VQIHPRYDGEPMIEVRSDPRVAVVAGARQRRRLAGALGTLDEAQWAAPSRCDGWTVKDVVSHLTSTNGFWSISIASALDGAPTRFLEGFDPKATPAALAAADAATGPAEALERFVESTEALCNAAEALDAEQLALLGEAPPGHVALHAVLLHALWDAWVHERDILLPLGLPVDEEPDEITASLRYGVALAPAFALSGDPSRRGALGVSVVGPDLECWVEVGTNVVVHDGPAPSGTPTIHGRGVDVLEAISVRRPLEADLPDEQRWLVDGLAEVFEEA